MELSGKKYWLVGASEGLGRAMAQQLSALGVHLVLSARTKSRLDDLAATLPGPANVVPLDVTDIDAVRSAAQAIGELDGVIYAAGVYTPTPTSKWDLGNVESMCEINFLGGARVLGAVVPEMVSKNVGHVVVIGSLSGFRGLPNSIGYSSSKAGLMHLAESIHADLHRTQVRVQLLNPGFIKTRLTEKNDFQMPFLMSPEDAAKHAVKAMQSSGFQHNFPLAFSWLFRAANWLPATIYYKVFGQK